MLRSALKLPVSWYGSCAVSLNIWSNGLLSLENCLCHAHTGLYQFSSMAGLGEVLTREALCSALSSAPDNSSPPCVRSVRVCQCWLYQNTFVVMLTHCSPQQRHRRCVIFFPELCVFWRAYSATRVNLISRIRSLWQRISTYKAFSSPSVQ